MKISDQLRAEAVTDYLRGHKSQKQVCVEMEARTGVRVSPRTLRAWISSAPPDAVLPDEVRARLVRALQHLRDLQIEVEAVLGIVHERDHHDPLPLQVLTRSQCADDPAAMAAGTVLVLDLAPNAADPAAASMGDCRDLDAAPPMPSKHEEFWK